MSLSCLHQAVCSGRLHQIRLLLDIGVSPKLVDNQGRTPLMMAACASKDTLATRIARLLLSRGAGVECVDHQGRTALSYACQHGHCKLVKLLIDDECDINKADKEGNTPLMYAAMSGNVPTLREILHVVLKYRLSVDLRNKKGFSAYLLAAKMANGECARILKTEANASDGVRDTEFFLSDKEWVKKTKRNLDKEKIEKKVDKIMEDRIRPYTSLELGRASKVSTSPRVNARAISRLTTRSEPAVTRKLGVARMWSSFHPELDADNQLENTRVTSPSSAYSSKQSSVPAVARTLTPDLHAIFSQYVLFDNRPAITVADRRPQFDTSSRKYSEFPSRPLLRGTKNSRVGAMNRKKVSLIR